MPKKIKAKKKVKHNIKATAKASNKTSVVVRIDQRRTTKGRKSSVSKPQIPSIINTPYPIYIPSPSYAEPIRSSVKFSEEQRQSPISIGSISSGNAVRSSNASSNYSFEPSVDFGMVYNPTIDETFEPVYPPQPRNIISESAISIGERPRANSEVSQLTTPMINNPLQRQRRTNQEIYRDLLIQNGETLESATSLANSTDKKILKTRINELKKK